MWRNHRLFSHSCGKCTERSKDQGENTSEGQRQCQSEGSPNCQWCRNRRREGQDLSKVRSRALRFQNRFRTDHALSGMGLRWEAVYADQDVSKQSRQLQREKYQPYPRWRFGDWFWWPTRWLKGEHDVRTRQWPPKPNSHQRLDSSDASLDVQPRVGARTIRSVAASSSSIPASSVSAAAARSAIQPGVVADVPAPWRGRRVHWGSVEHGYANGSDWSVIARSDAS